MRNGLVASLAVLSFFTVFVPVAHAQAWPAKPVTIVVTNGAGGPYDGSSRALGQALSQALGQPFVIDNRPAGSGIAGALAVAKAAPDGYTLLSTGSGNVTLFPALKKDLPYDPPKDFAPVMRMGVIETFLMVHPSVPAKSVSDLFDLARAKPNSVSWGEWGPISPSNMYIQWLKATKGIQFFAVPYKVAPQALQAGMTGEVQVTVFAQGQALPLIKAGKFRALAQSGSRRSPAMPDVPLLKETGTGFDLDVPLWIGLLAPAATPRDIVEKLNSVSAGLLRDRSYTDKALSALGFTPDLPQTTAEFAGFLKKDRAMYEDLIRVTGIKDE
jgi:tripartite-type tricarboxylate transporter receptor subunit TctC